MRTKVHNPSSDIRPIERYSCNHNPNPDKKSWKPEAYTSPFPQNGSTTTRHQHRDDDRISTAPPWAMAFSKSHHQNIRLIDTTHVEMYRH